MSSPTCVASGAPTPPKRSSSRIRIELKRREVSWCGVKGYVVGDA